HRIARWQFVLYQVGVLVLVAGKYDIDTGGNGTLAPPGSMMVVLGTLVMFWLFFTSSRGDA
ncbi:MAG: hypothetical protein LJE68_08935, partial [Rhodobacter sp.]|nr:hypothetical protein [Rhodobacter sp.]